MNEFTGLGVAGCLFLLLIREVLSFTGRRKNNNNHNSRRLEVELDKMRAKAIETSFIRLSESVDRCIAMLQALIDEMRQMRADRLDKCPMHRPSKERG